MNRENMCEFFYRDKLYHLRYHITALRGKGNFGAVFDVYDDVLRKEFVLKAVKSSSEISEILHEEVQAEANALSRLQIEGIPRIIDRFFEQGYECIVMECMSGVTLDKWIEDNRYSTDRERMEIGLNILLILKQLHQMTPPLWCGDIKPKNIIIKENKQVQIVDFGACRWGGEEKRVIFGTKGYAPPEQLCGDLPDCKTDVFSAGRVLFYLFSGIDPEKVPYDISAKSTQINPSVKRIVERCTTEDRDNRYANAGEIYQELMKVSMGRGKLLQITEWAKRFVMYVSIVTTFVLSVQSLFLGLIMHFSLGLSNGKWLVLIGLFLLVIFALMEKKAKQVLYADFVIKYVNSVQFSDV